MIKKKMIFFMLRGNNIWIPIWKIRKAGLGRKESHWYICRTSSAHTFCLILLNLISSLFSLLNLERDFHQLWKGSFCKICMSQNIALCHWQRHCLLASSPITTRNSSTPILSFGDILSLLDDNHWMGLHPYSVLTPNFSKQNIKAPSVEATCSW